MPAGPESRFVGDRSTTSGDAKLSLTAPDPDILSQRLRQVLLARQDREQVVYLQRNRDPDVYSGGRLMHEADAMAATLRAWLGPGDHRLVAVMPAGPLAERVESKLL